ncbi:prolyl oligopeptidase family serine peptidase [Halorubrum sp. AD140]|uniref:S9 family peptidase n=1 Tax=Halorubrum sp. AD140 TaxID=3050073 RepID=UPI002ACD0144|nr:prolyl oligopeptidase family serine peptidase [Halorubrum sp. AD140]MDZ5809833.1 prolyl oligopeptidase family serine peptidase [Halorubrum sp. AD140]
MYRRDLRDTDYDGLLADMAVADRVVQAAVGPDGRIAYAKTRELTTDLWLAADGADVRLTSEGASAMRYGRTDARWIDWSPDGDRIAFVTAESELATVDADTGTVEVLTDLEGGISGLAWGEPGIAIVTDSFSRASLAVVSPDGDRVEAIANDEYLYADPHWQGETVVATRSTHADFFDHEAALVRVPLDADGEVTELFAEPGVRAACPRPRPGDDEAVAFVHDGSGYDAVYGIDGSDVEGGADADPATALYGVPETEIAAPEWNDAGDRLAVTATKHGRVGVHAVGVDGALPDAESAPGLDADPESADDADVLASGDALHGAPRWDGDRVVSVRETPTEPPAVVDAASGERLTPPATAGLATRLPEPEAFTYDSGGTEIQAVIHPPPSDAEPGSVPLLVKPHGGPTAFDGFGFDHRAAYFAALGYAVVRPNYRGSDGFGRAFRMANDGDWGGGDLDDVIRAADATAVRYDAVDADRVGIFGGSGGGLMTVNALGTSDRFRAGAAFYGVYDYESFVDDTDDVGWQLLKRELGDFVDDLDAYRDASPIRTVPDIDDPLMVLHGEEDARVPISQSEQLVAELEAHGVRHELRRYDGEPHGFGKLEDVVDAYTRVADLFAKYLRELPDDGGSRPYEPPE